MKGRAARDQVGGAPAPCAHLEARNLELMRTLQILEEARANLADQYDFAPLGFVTLDDKGCIREINLTAARLLGRERSGLLGLPFFTLVEKARCRDFLHHLGECRARSGEVLSAVPLRTRAGALLEVELRSVPVLDPRGGGGMVFRTAITDISARLQAEKALRESEQRHRDLVEFSPDGIIILTDGAITFANSAALRLCGVEQAADLLGRSLPDLVRAAFRPAVQTMLEAKNGTARVAAPLEVRLARPDGRAAEVELAARPFHHEGGASVLVVARDITRRKMAERHALAISERERTAFGRDLHDSLCQTLMGAACLAEALRNQLRAASPEAAAAAAEIADVVRQAIGEARGMARGLCPVTMEKSGLVAALHELTAEVAGRARIGCTLECEETLAVADVGVATNVYRIAQEAVANAVKHGAAKAVRIQLAAVDGRTTLHVRDDGRGFPQKPKQTGMGLHTMRYRAAVIGGSLDVRRAGRRGTVVTCSFPTAGEVQ